MVKFLNKFFNNKPVREEDNLINFPIDKETLTLEEAVSEDQSLSEIQATTAFPHWSVGCGQSIGLVREHNEDALFTLSSLLLIDGKLLPIGLFIVADGMGGHQSGEVASDLAIRIVASHIIQRIILAHLDIAPSDLESSTHEILSESISAANKQINTLAPGSGTTLTALLILGKLLFLAHVGDSRAYTINPDGETKIITRDHSLVKRMIELGQLSEEEAAFHPQRNVLYKALGQGDPLSPDITNLPLPAGGYILVCSDGLWGSVSQAKLTSIILENQSPDKACQRLVDEANSAGGPDNITAILVKLA